MLWKLFAGAAFVAFAGFLVLSYGKARFNAGQLEERVAWQKLVAARERDVAELRVANERRIVAASERYAERVSTAEPVVIRSKETVTRYAATPAGAVLCLDSDRLLGIEADRAALFPGYPSAAQGGFATVPHDTTAPR